MNSIRTQAKQRHNKNPKKPKLVIVTNGDDEVVARRSFDIGYDLGKEWLREFEHSYADCEITVVPL